MRALALAAVLLVIPACAEQKVQTPDAVRVTAGAGPTRSAWTAEDQRLALAWLAVHPRRVGHNRYYGVVVASGVQGSDWTAVVVLASGRVLLVDGARSADLLVARGDAVELHAWNDTGTLALQDDPIVAAKGAVALP